jgi:site-specific DNA recombinase
VKTPVAYLRKSRVIDERSGVSWEVQEAKVRELAATYGDNGGRLLILSDWNVSGRKGAAARPDYARLLRMIEADEVSAIYGYNLSRLSRSVQDLRALFALADAHRTPVRLVADHVDTSTATGRMLFTILAAVDEMTADLASEHGRDAVAARRARGDQVGAVVYGGKPGENPAAVVAAYREKGSIRQAAILCNERKIPTRSGRPWSTTSVHDILSREGALPFRTRRGAKQKAPFVLYGLLRCGSVGCGHVMTGDRSHHGYTAPDASVRYRCHRGRTVPGHGPSGVPERRLLPWIKAEAARLTVPEAVIVEQERQEERDKIERRKSDLSFMLEKGGINRETYLQRLETIKTEEAALDAQEAATAILAVPESIDWDRWTPEEINLVLSAMWEYVVLDENMEPIRAQWTLPELRGGEPMSLT